MHPILLTLLVFLFLPDVSHGAILQVGPGRTYTVPSAAISASANGDTIEIDGSDGSGNQIHYIDDFATFSKTNLTIKGVGAGTNQPCSISKKCPHIRRATAQLPGNQGIWRPNHAYGTITTFTVENIEMSGAHSTQNNAQPVWATGTSVTLRNVYFHHSDNGFLGTNEPGLGINRKYEVLIEYSEFAHNGGLNLGYNTGAQEHNIYVGEMKKFTITGSYIHDSMNGQNIKSRANETFILYNRIADNPSGNIVLSPHSQPNYNLTGRSNYEIDLSIGGTNYVIGNVIYQASTSANKVMLVYRHETAPTGQENSAEQLYITNNTFVDASGTATTIFIWTKLVVPDPFVVKNNIFAGAVSGSKIWANTTAQTAQTTPIDNLVYTTIAAANFVDWRNQNYHLGAGSTAINAANVIPGIYNGVNLIPANHYVHPLSVATRVSEGGTRDMGAFETNSTLGATIVTPIAWTTSTAAAVTVGWTPSNGDTLITQYRVRRNGSPLATVTDALTYVDSTAVLGTTYSYTVIADTASGSSAESNAYPGGLTRQVTGTLSPAVGWQEILNTTLNTVINPSTNNHLLLHHTGFANDVAGNKFYIWGNGQTRADNSVYALNLSNLTVSQVNTTDTNLGTADEIIAGGRPNARQTHNGVSWIPTVGKLFSFGGFRLGMGYIQSTWLWTPGTDTWEKKSPTGTIPPSAASIAMYDSTTQKVYLLTQSCLDRYNVATNAYERPWACVGLTTAPHAVLDPVNNRIYVFGGWFGGWFNLTNGAYTAITSSGCIPLMASYPGLAWDPVSQKVVGWTGGDTVYIVDPATNTCTPQTFPGGPGFATVAGAYGIGSRFQYSPTLGAFIGFTETNKNAFALRLQEAAAPETDVPGRSGGGFHSGGGSTR